MKTSTKRAANATEVNHRWRYANRSKAAAHAKVNRALRDGVLTKQPCEVCGDSNSQGHHDDYSKPLSVRWLCNKHHCECHPNKQSRGPRIDKRRQKRAGKQPWPFRSVWMPAPKRDELLETAKALRSGGLSYKAISLRLSVSKGTVYKWINPRQY